MTNSLIPRLEETLEAIAKGYLPPKIDSVAAAHHWAFGIAYQTGLVGNPDQIALFETLKTAGLLAGREEFKAQLIAEIPFPPPTQPHFRFIDLFAGIGGFRLALGSLGGVCVFSSEWDKAAQITYLRNYGELPFGDITAFTSEEIDDHLLNSLIPDHEILAAGFPCQPFSHAGVSARNAVGKEHGFKCKTQGTLFFDIMRIASVKRPKVLFLENVSNIKSHDGGITFQVIRDSVEELGYEFKHAILDASPLVPQRRRRCYMVCFRRDIPNMFSLQRSRVTHCP